MTLASGVLGVDTYYLSESNFATVLTSPYDLNTINALGTQYEGITTFSVTNVSPATTGDDRYGSWDGYKAQPWPAATYSEMYRFENGDKAMGYIYNSVGTKAARWVDELVTLKGAFHGLSTVSISTSILICLAYLSF